MLSLHLETCDGAACALPVLLGWELEYSGGVPCDSLRAVCLYDAAMADVLPRAVRFTAFRDGETALHGVVDAYEVSLSHQGLLLTVEGRGMAALLLDNESEALSYERALLSEILENHAAPYGLSIDMGEEIAGGRYAVPSGSSQWRALQGFTRRFGGFDPHFTPGGTLVTAPLRGSGRTLTVDGGTPLLSLRRREQRYGVISEVLIQDKVQGVSHSVVNRDFARAGGCRRHVLYMPRSTAEDRRCTGEYQIEQSALEQLEITLELPYPFAVMPGDRVQLSLDRLGLHGEYDAVRCRCRMDGEGERTAAVLSGR